MIIFLCGFMGCGKTTIGKCLAEKLSAKYIDMDEYIEKHEGKKISQIFAEKGEPYFRQIEADTVKNLSETNGIISCGGGAMLNDKSSETARENGEVVFLDVPFDVCYERINNDLNRPIVMNNTKEQLKAIYDRRYPVYMKNSSICVHADDSPKKITETILHLLIDRGFKYENI